MAAVVSPRLGRDREDESARMAPLQLRKVFLGGLSKDTKNDDLAVRVHPLASHRTQYCRQPPPPP
mgnify:CR=1 FL=1